MSTVDSNAVIDAYRELVSDLVHETVLLKARVDQLERDLGDSHRASEMLAQRMASAPI